MRAFSNLGVCRLHNQLRADDQKGPIFLEALAVGFSEHNR